MDSIDKISPVIICHLYSSSNELNKITANIITDKLTSGNRICILKCKPDFGSTLSSIIRNLPPSVGKLLANKLQVHSLENKDDAAIREKLKSVFTRTNSSVKREASTIILRELAADLLMYIVTKIKNTDSLSANTMLIQCKQNPDSPRLIRFLLENCISLFYNNKILSNHLVNCNLEKLEDELDFDLMQKIISNPDEGKQLEIFKVEQETDFSQLYYPKVQPSMLVRDSRILVINNPAKEIIQENYKSTASDDIPSPPDLEFITPQLISGLNSVSIETTALTDKDPKLYRLQITDREPEYKSSKVTPGKQLSLHKSFAPPNLSDDHSVSEQTYEVITQTEHNFSSDKPDHKIPEILSEVLTEKASVGIYLIQDGLFKYVNPCFAQIFGYSPEEIENRLGPYDLCHPSERLKIKENIRKRFSGEIDTLRYDFKGLTKDNRVIRVEVFGSRTIYDGKPAISGTILDITATHRRELTQLLIYEIEREIRISDDLGKLLYRIHHKLKNLFELSNFFVALYNPGDERYSFPYFADQHDEPTEINDEEMKYSMTDYVRRNRRPLYADSETQELLRSEGKIRTVGTKSPLWIGAPLIHDDEVLGVVTLQSYDMTEYSSPEDLDLLVMLAERIATAIVYHRTKDALLQSQEKFTKIISNIPGCAYSFKLDDSLQIEYLSHGAEEIFGIKPDYLIGNNKIGFLHLVHQDDRQMYIKSLGEAVDIDSKFELKYRINKSDGGICWVHDLASFTTTRDDKTIQVEGFLHDITMHKKEQEEFSKTYKLLLAALESSPAGVVIADAPDVNIVIANSAAREIRGPTPLPLTNIHVALHPKRWQIYFPDGTICFPEELPLSRAVLFGETTSNMEIIIRRDSGEDRWVSCSAAPVHDSSGNIVAGVAVFPDITERKAIERELKKTNTKLQTERMNLREKNIALRELLNQIDREKATIEEQIQTNLDTVILPLIHTLRKRIPSRESNMASVIEKALGNVVSPFVNKLRASYSRLTPRELEICSLIRQGLTSKEISTILNLSPQTIHQQRKMIRRKLGLTNTDTNLTSYLNSNYSDISGN